MKFLNRENVYWVDIIEHKYGLVSLEHINITPNCSWFFRSLCKNLDATKIYWKLNLVNLNCTLVLEDLWIFDMPINAKSTFVNMDLLNENLQLNEFIHNDRWSLTSLQQFLSPHITPRFTSLGRLDLQSHNHWVWSSNTHVCNIVFKVYNTLNTSHTETAPWQGWKKYLET